MAEVSQLDSARAFTRSLNILVKYARLYGLDHQRTVSQLAVTFLELGQATRTGEALLLGTAEGKLVLDGVPLTGQAETRFAELLQAAGIASVQFASNVTEPELKAFSSAFAGTAPSDIPKVVKAVLGTRGSIQLNEVRFVAQDPNGDQAANLAARTLGNDVGQLAAWMADPEKLLQLITAAEGARATGPGAPGTGGTDATAAAAGNSGTGNGPGLGGSETGLTFSETTLRSVIALLTRFADAGEDGPTPAMLAEATAADPDLGRVLRAVMSSVPDDGMESDPNSPPLVKLAERLAIRFALQQYERGEVKVNAVHEMMERMSKEIETLRTVVTSHEKKMNRAGMMVESHADILDRQFWASVPERGKQLVLLSKDAYCIPPRNVRSYVEELLARGDAELAGRVLRSYARAVDNPDPDARKKVACGLQELADLYGRTECGLLQETVGVVGMRVCCEQSLELQTLLSAAYVRLTQEAAQRRDYQALTNSLRTLERLHEYRPRSVESIRPRVAIENRLHEFVAEAAAAPLMPDGLLDLLRLSPRATAETLALQFTRAKDRSESEKLVALTEKAGGNVIECLIAMLRSGSADEAARCAGILSRLDLSIVGTELSRRIKTFSRLQQDAIVRQLAAAGAVGRGKLLLELIEEMDALIIPEALDEIGMAGDPVAAGALLEMAEGEGRAKGEPYIRVKSIEALGRLREASATDALMAVAQPAKFWVLKPRELRLTATQALLQIDPEREADLVAFSGFSKNELYMGALAARSGEWLRQRRYPRVAPPAGLSVVATTANARCNVGVQRISLGGGLLSRDSHMPRCGEATVEMRLGLQRLCSRVLLRDLPTREVAYEVLDMDLEGRGRLRKLLLEQCGELASVGYRAAPANNVSIS